MTDQKLNPTSHTEGILDLVGQYGESIRAEHLDLTAKGRHKARVQTAELYAEVCAALRSGQLATPGLDDRLKVAFNPDFDHGIPSLPDTSLMPEESDRIAIAAGFMPPFVELNGVVTDQVGRVVSGATVLMQDPMPLDSIFADDPGLCGDVIAETVRLANEPRSPEPTCDPLLRDDEVCPVCNPDEVAGEPFSPDELADDHVCTVLDCMHVDCDPAASPPVPAVDTISAERVEEICNALNEAGRDREREAAVAAEIDEIASFDVNRLTAVLIDGQPLKWTFTAVGWVVGTR